MESRHDTSNCIKGQIGGAGKGALLSFSDAPREATEVYVKSVPFGFLEVGREAKRLADTKLSDLARAKRALQPLLQLGSAIALCIRVQISSHVRQQGGVEGTYKPQAKNFIDYRLPAIVEAKG